MLRIDITNQVTSVFNQVDIRQTLDMFYAQNLDRWCEIASEFEDINCHVLVKLVDEKLPEDIAQKIANIPPESGNDSNYLTYIVSQAGDAVIILNMLIEEANDD